MYSQFGETAEYRKLPDSFHKNTNFNLWHKAVAGQLLPQSDILLLLLCDFGESEIML